MRVSKRQLKRIIKEEKIKLREGPITAPGATWEDRITMRDVDNDRPIATRVSVQHGMITIEFSNSFTLHLDGLDARALAQLLLDAEQELEFNDIQR